MLDLCEDLAYAVKFEMGAGLRTRVLGVRFDLVVDTLEVFQVSRVILVFGVTQIRRIVNIF